MKITFVLLLACFMTVSASTMAQKITLNTTDANLKTVLKEIKKQSGYNFVIEENLLNNAQPVTLHLSGANIDDALKQLFEARQLTYTVEGKVITIKEKQVSFLDKVKDFFTSTDVSGVVIDEKGQPLPGTTVRVKNGSKFTSADQNGYFVLNGVNENDILEFTFLGYKTKEIPANAGLRRIQMELSSSKLDEVQIEAYGKSSKRTSVNDITTVKGADFEKQPLDNPLEALQGRVPGLIITPSSGMPGAATTIQLRGQNSLAGPLTQPLILVDGVPITNNIEGAGYINLDFATISSLAAINPVDIESIDVLKDADATSIYGSKGANGVILITTKKGKSGDTRITASSYTGYSSIIKEAPMMNTQQYLQMRKDAYIADGNPVPTNQNDNYDLTVWDQNRYTDWQKVFLDDHAIYNKNDASISGGTPYIQYFLSGSYSNQGFMYKGPSKYQKDDGHFSITGNSANQKFRAELTGGYTGVNAVNGYDLTAAAINTLPNAPALFNSSGGLNWEPNPVTGYATWTNPLAGEANENYQKTATLYTSINLSYKISPSLTIKTTAGITDVNLHGFGDQTIASQDPATITTAIGSSTFSNNSSNSWTVVPQLTYDHNIGRGLFTALVGASLDELDQYNQEITGLGYTNDALLHSLINANSYGSYNAAVQDRDAAVFARAEYNWNDKYIFTANARRDGSSRFGAGHQYGNFASFGLAWVFTNEEIIKKALPFLSFGKIRFTDGTSGNDDVPDYQNIGYYKTVGGNGGFSGDPVTYQGIKPLFSQGAFNPDFRWESVNKMEWGTTLAFFNDRIVIDGTYYRNRSSNQLSLISLPATAGSTYITVNLPAKIQNMGGDFTLTTTNIKSKNFSWTTTGNISFQRNKLLSLPSANYDSNFPAYLYYLTQNLNPVGKAFSGVASVYQFRGVDPATGVYMFTGFDGKPTTFDQANAYGGLVSTNPQYYGGMGNTFTYKGLSMSVFLQYMKQNGLNYLYQSDSPPGYTNGYNQPAALINYWKKPGDITQVQRVSQQGYYIDPNTGNFYDLFGAQAAAKQSTAAYTDASFIRVKSVTLSYGIPESWARKIGVKSLAFNMSAENLFTITGYKGVDPQTQTIYALPLVRTITAGFNILL